MEKKVPIGVQIISVLYFIGSVFGVIFGVLSVGTSFNSSTDSQIQIIKGLEQTYFIIAGL